MPTYAQLLGARHPMAKARGPARRARLPRRRRAAPKSFAKKVLAVVNKEADTKFVAESIQLASGSGTGLNSYTGFSSAINTVNEIYAAIPQVELGPGDHQRIGSHISPTSCYLDLNICATAANDKGARDKTVHIFVLSAKGVKSLDNYSAIPITTLLNIGNGTNGPFNGASMSQTLPVNTNEFIVLHHKAIRMTKGSGLANSSVQADSVVSPSSSFRRVRMKVRLPKTLQYANDSTDYPVNAAPFMVIGYTSGDQGGDTAPTAVDTYVEGRVMMYYKDI